MRILIIGDCEAESLAKCYEAFRTGLRRTFDTRLFGEGYEGFDSAITSFPEILAKTFPDARPDLVIVPYDIAPGARNPYRYQGIENIQAQKAVVLDEYWKVTDDPKDIAAFLANIETAAIDYILSYFQQPMELLKNSSLRKRLIYLPPSFDPEIFNDWEEQKRFDVGFLAAGTIDYTDFYAERFLIHQNLLAKPGLNYFWAKHPGLGKHTLDHPLVGKGFSKTINSCRLFVTTGGKYRNAQAKYVEILASKSVLLADMPVGGEVLKLQDGVNFVQISPENVEMKIDYYLAHPELCERIAQAGYETAMRYHSCYARALDFADCLKERRKVKIELPKIIRLNFGCGKEYKKGWLNIDIDPEADADLYMEFLKIDEIVNPRGVSEALVRSLSELTLLEARKFFVMLYRLFERGGRLRIETPNLETSFEKIINCRENFAVYLEGLGALHPSNLNQFEERKEELPNSFSWTPWHLERELSLAGFVNIKTLAPEKEGLGRDMRIEAEKPFLESNGRTAGSVLILYDMQLGTATAQVRGFIHEEMYERKGWTAIFRNVREHSELEILNLAAKVDLVYLLKVNALELIRKIKEFTRAKVVFDLTDALWTPLYRSTGWHEVDEILSAVDAIFSENEFVCAYGRKFNRVYSIPVVTHEERFAKIREVLPSRNDGKIRIGWIGSTGTMTGIFGIKPQLEILFNRYPNLELRIVGCQDPNLIAQLDPIRYSVRPKYGEIEMLEEILQMDIGIFPAPLDLEDYAIRGAQKAFLYMQGGIPAVALNAGDCATAIKDGETGMLVNSPDEWVVKLERLILSPTLRESMGKKGAIAISEGHSHEHVFTTLEQAFWDVLSGSAGLSQ